MTTYAPARAACVVRSIEPNELAGRIESEPAQQLLRDGDVVGPEVRAVIEDRDRTLGRLGIRDRGADRRLKQPVAEVLAQRVECLAGVAGAHVGDVQHHAEPHEVRVEAVAGQIDHLECLLDALEREVLRLGRQQRVVGRDQRIDGQQAQRRRAVDQHQVVLALDIAHRSLERQLASHLAAERQLGLGEPEVGRHDPVVDRLGRRRAPGEHVTDRGRRLGVDIQVVGQIALRIEVDREHRQPGPAKDVRQGPHRCRLAGTALLGQHGDRRGHPRLTIGQP